MIVFVESPASSPTRGARTAHSNYNRVVGLGTTTGPAVGTFHFHVGKVAPVSGVARRGRPGDPAWSASPAVFNRVGRDGRATLVAFGLRRAPFAKGGTRPLRCAAPVAVMVFEPSEVPLEKELSAVSVSVDKDRDGLACCPGFGQYIPPRRVNHFGAGPASVIA